jgi:hypothetical protein
MGSFISDKNHCHSKFLGVHSTPSIFLAYPFYGTWRKLIWCWRTCYACHSVSNYSADLWSKREVAGCRRGMIWSQQLSFLQSLSPLSRQSTCRPTELQYEYEFICDGHSQTILFIGVDLVGHGKCHLILYLYILPLHKSLYTGAHFKITSNIILHT